MIKNRRGYNGFRNKHEWEQAAGYYLQQQHEQDARAGEFQFSSTTPGRVDEYHGITHDGTSEGLFNSGHPYTHTVNNPDGTTDYHRDSQGNVVINTHRDPKIG